jgi:LPS-assembly protein
MALLLCHAFVRPGLLTSQLRPAQEPQNPAQTPSPAVSNSGANSAAQPYDPDSDPLEEDETEVGQPQSNSKATPATGAKSDSGQVDPETEQLVQQAIDNSGEEDAGPQRPATNVPLGRNEVLIRADQQEKSQDIFNCRGHVEIRFGTNTLHADEATYDSTTGILKAKGHVVFDSSLHNAHLVGSAATYDVSRDSGTFYDVTGSTGVKVKSHTMFLSSSTPFFFTGKVVDKIGPDQYRVSHGYVTSCELPKPKWTMDSKTADVEVGDEAKMRHATLKIHGLPVFYFPYLEHPVDNLGRKSGFLIPTIGQSNTRGTIFGDGFYWAISRNVDATMGAALYSARGWAQFGDFRAIGYTYGINAQYYGVLDNKGAPNQYPYYGAHQGGRDIRVNAFKNFGNGWNGVLAADYLSSYIFRQVFALAYAEAIQSEVRSTGFVNKEWNSYFFGVMADSYQNYQSTAQGDFIQIVHSPSVEFASAERPFSRSGFTYAFDTAGGGLSRNEPGFETAPFVGRMDAGGYIAWPKLFDGWTFRPEVGARETYYAERLEPGPSTEVIGVAVHSPINRNVASASVEVRPPTLSRIFDHKPFGRVLKHTIEPYAIYRYQSGIDNFSQILRFDSRDILADTNEIEYGFVNRLFAKNTKLSPKCFEQPKNGQSEEMPAGSGKGGFGVCQDPLPAAREVFSWTFAQKYYANSDFGGALVPGKRNVFDSTVDLTGIAFLTEPRVFSPIISRLRASGGAADFQWDLDYDPVLQQVNANSIFVGYRWSTLYFNAGSTYVNAPGELTVVNGQAIPNIYNQWRMGVTYGGMNKRGLSAAVNVGVDSRTDLLQSTGIQTNYNWDCCGVAFQYSRWVISQQQSENTFQFSFSLTNIGTFGNMKRMTRLY